MEKRSRGTAESLTFSYAAYQQHREEVHEGDQRRHPRAGKDPHPLQWPSAPARKAPGQQDSQRLPSVVSTCGRTKVKGRALRERKEGSQHCRGRWAAEQSPERQRSPKKAITAHGPCGEARQPFALMPQKTGPAPSPSRLVGARGQPAPVSASNGKFSCTHSRKGREQCKKEKRDREVPTAQSPCLKFNTRRLLSLPNSGERQHWPSSTRAMRCEGI